MEKEELLKEIKRLRKERDEAVKMIEDVLYCQRMTEYDNKRLRKQINLNASLFNKLIGSKSSYRFEMEKILSDEEIVKKNGGYADREFED